MEVVLEEITLEEYPKYSALAFAGDVDMETTYGTIKEGETATDRNIKNIQESSKIFDIKYYKVKAYTGNEWMSIGMTAWFKVEGQALLYSFGINIAYRTSEILKAWMKELDKVLGIDYKVALFLKNTRAIRFFTKNGFVNHQEVESEKGILMWR